MKLITHKLSSYILYILLSICCLASTHASAAEINNNNNHLYPGEQIKFAHGYPALIKFIKGDLTKPLVIFVPGNAHLGRIAYGYPGSDEKDFIAYWFKKHGYSFLSVSYPTDNPVYTNVYPEFTIRDWGVQVAEIANQIINEYKLTNHIIVLGWSMGGVIAESINEAAENKNLTLDFFVALAATPPLPNLIPEQEKTIVKAANGLENRIPLRKERFYNFLLDQDKLNAHQIIPKDIYIRDFLGNPPVALINTAYRYKNGKFVLDPLENLQDSGAHQYAHYPLVAVMHGNSSLDAQHVIADGNTWMMLNNQKIYHHLISPQSNRLLSLTAKEWNQLRSMIDSINILLMRELPGNHFFFVGKLGAQKTVHAIIGFSIHVKNIEHQLHVLLEKNTHDALTNSSYVLMNTPIKKNTHKKQLSKYKGDQFDVE